MLGPRDLAAEGLRRDVMSFHVEGLGAGRLARSVERDLLDPRLGLAQQLVAAALERLAALVDRHRFLERHLALFEALHDRFELLDRLLERKLLDVGVFGHLRSSNAGASSAQSKLSRTNSIPASGR